LIQIINTLSKIHHSTCHKAASGIAKSSDYSILRLIFVAMLLFLPISDTATISFKYLYKSYNTHLLRQYMT